MFFETITFACFLHAAAGCNLALGNKRHQSQVWQWNQNGYLRSLHLHIYITLHYNTLFGDEELSNCCAFKIQGLFRSYLSVWDHPFSMYAWTGGVAQMHMLAWGSSGNVCTHWKQGEWNPDNNLSIIGLAQVSHCTALRQVLLREARLLQRCNSYTTDSNGELSSLFLKHVNIINP